MPKGILPTTSTACGGTAPAILICPLGIEACPLNPVACAQGLDGGIKAPGASQGILSQRHPQSDVVVALDLVNAWGDWSAVVLAVGADGVDE